ncbi:MAG: hypothetical protein ABIQ39_09130 [Ilumatobacteraceae bacterium]
MNPTLEQPDEIPTETTLASLLHASMVDFDLLDDRYHALLQLVDAVLGVVPNCDRYLEIWPPAFRTYNIMVPNLLNLPVPVFGVGGPTPTVIGLAMYVASRTAECPYCSAHSCSFAMRRGAASAVVAAALLPERACFSRGELAAIAVARSLARVPGELTQGEKAELIAVYGERNAEWIVLSVVMMGFLNKFMDAIGVELEQGVADEVSATMGPDWSPGNAGADLDLNTPRSAPPVDGLRTKLRLLPLLPGAVRYDRQAQRGVPSKAPAVGAFLTKHVGHDFPILAELHSNRARRAIASMLRENLDPTTSAVGMETKVLAGTIFATVVDDESLAGDIAALASHAGVAPERLRACAAFARGQRTHPPAASAPGEAALVLALAASSSPARIDGSTVDALRAQGLSPEAIVEVITWLAVLQMMHRLTCYTSVEGLKNVTTLEERNDRGVRHDRTQEPRRRVDRHLGVPRPGLRARLGHHPHGRVEPRVLPVRLVQRGHRPRQGGAFQSQEQRQARAILGQLAGGHRSRARQAVRLQPKWARHRLIHLAIRHGTDPDRYKADRILRRRATARLGHDVADDEVDRKCRPRRRPA